MRNEKRNPKRKKPCHIKQEIWNSWLAKWNTPEFKNKSTQNKINRRGGVEEGPALGTHHSGSASHLKVAADMVSFLLCLLNLIFYVYV